MSLLSQAYKLVPLYKRNLKKTEILHQLMIIVVIFKSCMGHFIFSTKNQVFVLFSPSLPLPRSLIEFYLSSLVTICEYLLGS